MKALLTLLFAVLIQATLGQTTFNVVRQHPSTISYTGALSVNELPDGYLVFSFGWSLDSAVAAVQVAKFDFEGNFIWEKEHRRQRDTYPGIIDPIASISASRYVGALTEYGDTLPEATYLYWWDSEGDTIRTRFFKSDSNAVESNHGTRQLLALADGGFLHCGWCANTLPGQGGCTTRLDSTGAILWERIYPQAQYIQNARETSDGGFVLGGSRNADQDEAVVIRTDSAGNVEWVRYHGLYSISGARRALADVDGNFLVPGQWKDDPTWSVYDTWASAYHYAPNGTLLQRKDFYFGRNASAGHILAKGDTHYWLVGGTELPGEEPDHVTQVWEIDENLDSIWMRRYWFYGTNNASSSVYAVRTTSDGGLVMCGMTRQGETDPLPNLRSNWLIKLDSYGCLVPGCQNVGIEEVALGLNEYLSVSPNPVAQGQPLRVSFEPPAGSTPKGALRVVVVDALGKQVQEQTMSAGISTFNFPLSAFSTGLYYLHLTDGTRWLAGAKVVVE